MCPTTGVSLYHSSACLTPAGDGYVGDDVYIFSNGS